MISVIKKEQFFAIFFIVQTTEIIYYAINLRITFSLKE